MLLESSANQPEYCPREGRIAVQGRALSMLYTPVNVPPLRLSARFYKQCVEYARCLLPTTYFPPSASRPSN